MFQKFKGLEANLRKHFLILLTGRRNFVPILSIYYLSLPDTKAQEIWFYTAAGYAISLIFQIPAGILWDKLGNKITIIIAKVCLVASSMMYVFGTNFRYFLLGSILMSLGADAFSTGNTSAFLHDTLTNLKREHDFKKISSSIKGWVSFVSIFLIIALPFFTKINLVFPFKIGLVIDIIGLLIAFSLFPAKGNREGHEPISLKRVQETIKESRGSWLLSIIVFSGIIGAFLMVDWSFRSPYLQSLWYPIIYIWFVMGLSRFVRFIVGQYAHKIEKIISLKALMALEVLLFSAYYMSTSFFNNPYIVGIIFSLVVGYFWGREEVYTDHIINRIPWRKYKSTILSLKGQISGIIQVIVMLLIGIVMTHSYKQWFFILGITLLILLSTTYFVFLKTTKKQELKI